MTRGEADILAVLVGEFRQFRDQDSEWKSRVDERLRTTEEYIASDAAVKEREKARGFSRRAAVASTIAAVGVLSSILIGVANLLFAR